MQYYLSSVYDNVAYLNDQEADRLVTANLRILGLKKRYATNNMHESSTGKNFHRWQLNIRGRTQTISLCVLCCWIVSRSLHAGNQQQKIILSRLHYRSRMETLKRVLHTIDG
jgi:hypothetical protein